MKILVLGKNGQVGSELQRSLQGLGELIFCGRDEADLSQPESLRYLLQEIQPQVIVNAAAYTAVDKAETEVGLAHVVNAVSPGVLAEEAYVLGAWLIHYSTDYVFNGSGTTPWVETSRTDPLNVYGMTKRAGEEAIEESGCKHLILRTSWVYGVEGGNFAKTMLKLAQERDALSVIADQFGAPTGAALLADVTAALIPRLLSAEGEANARAWSGIYHLAAAGETTWYDYACFVLRTAQAAGVSLKVSPEAVKAIPATDYPLPATRPANSRLNCQKLSQTFGLTLPEWQVGVQVMLEKYLKQI